MQRALGSCLIVIAMTAAGTAEAASDPLAFYVGATVGEAHVRASVPIPGYLPTTGPYFPFDQRATGWEAFVGWRPISLLGAELGYVDFGHPSYRSAPPPGGGFFYTQSADVEARAPVLSALVFAPLPLPLFDIYAKVGVARLHQSGHSSNLFTCTAVIVCPPPAYIPPVSWDRSASRLAYGGGAQLKLATLAVRLEYQRINAYGEDPDLLSLGLAWMF